MKITEKLADLGHLLHGSRGLGIALLAMIFLTIIEPAFPAGWARAAVTVPVFAVGVIGLFTLPREGVAVQRRLHRLVEDEYAGRSLARHLLFPLILVVLLLPQSFLAAYGIPHMSPLTGLVLPSMQQRFAAFFLFGLLIIPIWHLRRTSVYAPEVHSERPRDLSARSELHNQRDLLLALVFLAAIAWMVLLRPFWAPFSLFAWPPGFGSFGDGIRDISAVAYAVFLPVILLVHMSAHAQGIKHLIDHAGWRTHWHRFTLLWLHVLLGLAATALHVYNLLWIVRYQALAGF